ncbi:hypothetical protein HanPI659440_Chr16g0650911 [Helianthus annuus]|nr:hypothetical protein HanPI659440_Chr16g0650911 [Helianthus annuus]
MKSAHTTTHHLCTTLSLLPHRRTAAPPSLCRSTSISPDSPTPLRKRYEYSKLLCNFSCYVSNLSRSVVDFTMFDCFLVKYEYG